MDNMLYVTIPQADIETLTFGYYNITINAIGEDDKPIGYAVDSWGDVDAFAEQISFNYNVEKMLEVTAMTPDNGATVKQLDKVTMTFSENIFEVDSWSSAVLMDENYDEVAEAIVTFEGNVATLTFDPAITTAGYYTLYINQGMFATEEYVTNAEMYIDYIVDPNSTPAVEDLAILSATPENGATVANLTTVEFKLNKEVGYLYKSMLIPADGGDDAASASLTQSETDSTSYTLDFTFDGLFANGATLRKDVTYTLTLEAYASEEAWQRDGAYETVTLTYVGAAEAFKYSDVTFESITPAEDFVISDKSQNKFVVKFSGAVEMVENLTFVNMGQGATQAFESIVPNADKTEYTLTIAESVLETLRNEVYIVFAANDAKGKRVQGNNGEEENSCFAISFKTVIGIPDLTVTPDATAEQASLSVLTIGCSEGLAPSWNAGNITLTDANGNTVALNDPEAVVDGADEFATPTAWTVALAEELKTVGTYTLTIPAGYFNLGKTQGQVMGNKETVVVFNITDAAQGINGITIDTEVVVYNVAGVVVAQGNAGEVLKNLNKGIYIVNGKKFVIK
ncbi:MAG: Ig-like domain-containing protein [Bacteroidaceae bacterium]|nr:Ig-like domain-containing protein [Bacteroidaceae bacterium]